MYNKYTVLRWERSEIPQKIVTSNFFYKRWAKVKSHYLMYCLPDSLANTCLCSWIPTGNSKTSTTTSRHNSLLYAEHQELSTKIWIQKTNNLHPEDAQVNLCHLPRNLYIIMEIITTAITYHGVCYRTWISSVLARFNLLIITTLLVREKESTVLVYGVL